MAFEKLSVPQGVVDEALNRAAGAGKVAGGAVLEQLMPYAGKDDIFDETQIADFAKRKYDEAANRYLKEIINGKHNVKASKRPGLTALVGERAKDRMEQVFSVLPQTNLYEVEFEAVADTTADGRLFIARMPLGGFVELTEITMEFSDIVEPIGERSVRATANGTSTARVAAFDVVTVAGDAGEYWQNRHFNIDGSYR